MTTRRLKDKGPARYFHGRKKIRKRFADLLNDAAKDTHDSTIVLVQGPPGAGKTALLHELATNAAKGKQKWDVKVLTPLTLESPAAMADALGVQYAIQTDRKLGGNLKVVERSRTKMLAGLNSVRAVLEDAVGRKGRLLFVLDEAQRLQTQVGRPSLTQVEDTLDAIRNAMLGRSVVLLAGGLGHTSKVFEQLGILRLEGKCKINLGRLDSADERAVIRDWLEKEGQAEEDVVPWIDAISRETQGWPQHIIVYSRLAAWHIQADKGRLDSAGLLQTLKEGRAAREDYYRQRLEGVDARDQVLLGLVVVFCGRREHWSLDDLDAVMSTRTRGRGVTPEDVVDRLIAKGVIADNYGKYHVPIPSMETWLIRQVCEMWDANISRTLSHANAVSAVLIEAGYELTLSAMGPENAHILREKILGMATESPEWSNGGLGGLRKGDELDR